jgi:hypothetical protein
MKAAADKSEPVSQSRATASRPPLRPAGPSASFESPAWHAYELVDHRSATVAQRKLQELANGSPQVRHAAEVQQRVDNSARVVAQRKQVGAVLGSAAWRAPNTTGLPDELKSGAEALSGLSMDDVRVHYGSSRPAQLQALAHTEGTDIHVAPGQEGHLAHEAWHVVQQKQGRVRPTGQILGQGVNDDPGLEREADLMAARIGQEGAARPAEAQPRTIPASAGSRTVQRIAVPPVLRQQTGGTCGCYSLWMALESIHGRDNNLIGHILEAARDSGSVLGENFSYTALSALIQTLNPLLTQNGINYQVTARQLHFANLGQFYNLITSSPDSQALLIAYSASSLYGIQDVADPSQAAHWSLIEGFNGRNIDIVNPWGRRDTFDVRKLKSANDDLQTNFNWTHFAREVLKADTTTKLFWTTNAEITSYAQGIGKGEDEVRELVEQLAKSKVNRVEPINLQGYLVAIT